MKNLTQICRNDRHNLKGSKDYPLIKYFSMYTGKVKFYNIKSKFGFIEVDGTGKEIFTRKSYLIDSIKDGDMVSFEIEIHPKGDIAKQVRLIDAD